ncbi:uncharacterized protein LOC116296251 [Actinia tenebrosa]|uniref:Uncharacterized protein LOC116296251 n=1 Tax=Actinia tenebrosa TaxID=6105 RepID=A0A6P8I589_ACTTE|nr:uncharacterized protein LOC116296251 [Actinia tenebrosa]
MNVHRTIVMQFLWSSLALLWILLPGFKALPLKTCTEDQYKRILHNGSFVCIDCFMCPTGLGPSVECGSTISPDTKLECKKCEVGVSFSPSNDYEQCQLCSVCSEDQVSKPCTPDSDTICEKRCMSKDKYYEKSSDDCQDCSWCCEDGNDVKIDECSNKGMPAQKSCTVHRKKLCKPPPTAGRSTTALPMTLPLTATTIQWQPTSKKTSEYNEHWHSREPTKGKPSNHSKFEHSNINNSSSSNNSASTIEMQVLLGVCSGLVILFIVAVLVCLYMKYHKQCGICTKVSKKSQRKLEVVYTKVLKEEEDSTIASYKGKRLFELFKSNPKLKEEVCNKLDLKKSFAKVARR